MALFRVNIHYTVNHSVVRVAVTRALTGRRKEGGSRINWDYNWEILGRTGEGELVWTKWWVLSLLQRWEEIHQDCTNMPWSTAQETCSSQSLQCWWVDSFCLGKLWKWGKQACTSRLLVCWVVCLILFVVLFNFKDCNPISKSSHTIGRGLSQSLHTDVCR